MFTYDAGDFLQAHTRGSDMCQDQIWTAGLSTILQQQQAPNNHSQHTVVFGREEQGRFEPGRRYCSEKGCWAIPTQYVHFAIRDQHRPTLSYKPFVLIHKYMKQCANAHTKKRKQQVKRYFLAQRIWVDIHGPRYRLNLLNWVGWPRALPPVSVYMDLDCDWGSILCVCSESFFFWSIRHTSTG